MEKKIMVEITVVQPDLISEGESPKFEIQFIYKIVCLTILIGLIFDLV